MKFGVDFVHHPVIRLWRISVTRRHFPCAPSHGRDAECLSWEAQWGTFVMMVTQKGLRLDWTCHVSFLWNIIRDKTYPTSV